MLIHELSELDAEPVPVQEVQEDQKELEHEKDTSKLGETCVQGNWGVRVIHQLLLYFERDRGFIIKLGFVLSKKFEMLESHIR